VIAVTTLDNAVYNIKMNAHRDLLLEQAIFLLIFVYDRNIDCQAISIKYYIPCGFNRGLSFPVSFLKEEKNGCISTITKTVIDTEIWEWSMFGT
jgi:hypothetical protein